MYQVEMQKTVVELEHGVFFNVTHLQLCCLFSNKNVCALLCCQIARLKSSDVEYLAEISRRL